MHSEIQICRRLTIGLLSCCVMWFASAQTGHAAEPRLELWQLVPKDVGLAVEARGLSEHSRRFLTSTLFNRIEQHSAWKQLLQRPESQDLEAFQQTVKEVTQQPLLIWLEKLLGQEALLSITPQPTGRPRAALLLRLKDGDLPEILAAWQKLEARTETRLEHQGQAYFSRTKTEGDGDPLFYAAVNDVLIVSDQSAALIPILDLAKDPEHRGAVQNESNFQLTMKALHPATVVRVFIQPAAWNAIRETRQPDAKDPVERMLHRAWGRCQALGLGVREESGLVAELVARSDDLASNPFWKKLIAKTAGAPAFLKQVPQSAILAFAGRHDLANITDWVLSQIPTEGLKKLKSVRQVTNGFLLGNDLLTDILPRLPADFGGYVVPRDASELSTIPADGLLAISLPAPVDGDSKTAQQPRKTDVRSSVDNALRTGVSLLAALHNTTASDEAEIEQVDEGGVTVHWIDSLGPIQPAYAISRDYLLLASSPRLIRDFLTQPASKTWGAVEELQQLQAATFADASQIVALNGKLLGSLIRERREFLLKQLETFHKLQPDDAAKRLDRMLEWIQLSDAVVIASSLHADHLKVVLVIAVREESGK